VDPYTRRRATVSARFQQRGPRTLMFLSTLRGLSIYRRVVVAS